MRLIPIVVLIAEDDLTTLQPIIEDTNEMLASIAKAFGWTPEMVAWAGLLKVLARAVRDGTIEAKGSDGVAAV